MQRRFENVAFDFLSDPILLLNERQQAGLFDSSKRREERDLYHAGVPADFDSARNRCAVHDLGDGQREEVSGPPKPDLSGAI